LGVGQHESFHPKLESQSSLRWNPDSQQALALLWQILGVDRRNWIPESGFQ
jgi:hypothetical protein